MAAANWTWRRPSTSGPCSERRGARSSNYPDPLRPTGSMYAERLVISAGADPLRSVRCPRCTPAAIVVGGVQEGRAYERNSIEAIMAENRWSRKPNLENRGENPACAKCAPANLLPPKRMPPPMAPKCMPPPMPPPPRANAGDVTATVAPSAPATKQLTSLLIVPLFPCSVPQRG
jgi:hypothetical protein